MLSPATLYVASMVNAINDMASPKPKTIAFISADDGFSKTASAAGVAKAKELGFEVVAEEFVPNQTTDVSSALTKIKPKNPDVILGSVHLSEGIAIVKQSAELGIKPMVFGETVAPPTPDFATTLGRVRPRACSARPSGRQKTAGSEQFFGTRDRLRQDVRGAVRRPAADLPQRRGDRGLPGPRPGGAEGRHDRTRPRCATRWPAWTPQSFFGPIKFNANGMNIYKQMGGHPDPGRQGGAGVAEGRGRGTAEVARRRSAR